MLVLFLSQDLQSRLTIHHIYFGMTSLGVGAVLVAVLLLNEQTFLMKKNNIIRHVNIVLSTGMVYNI